MMAGTNIDDIDESIFTGPERWGNIQELVRQSDPIPYLFGWNSDAGVRRLNEITRQYLVYCKAFSRPSVWIKGIPALGAMLVGCGTFVLFTNAQPWTGDGGTYIYLVLSILATFMGWFAGLNMRGVFFWKTAYAKLMVLEYNDPLDSARLTRGGSTFIPQLAFCAEPEDFYFGNPENSGVRNGDIVLQTNKPIMWLNLKDLYTLRPGTPTNTGNTARDAASGCELATDSGQVLYQAGRKFGDKLVKAGVIGVTLIVLCICFLQASSGYGLDPLKKVNEYRQELPGR